MDNTPEGKPVKAAGPRKSSGRGKENPFAFDAAWAQADTEPPGAEPTSDGLPSAASKSVTAFQGLLELFRQWLRLLFSVSIAMAQARKVRGMRPWSIRIGRHGRPAKLNQADVDQLLQRHRDLKDMDKIAGMSARFHLPESDFFADPFQVERLIHRFLLENPPWLRISRVLSGAEEGAETQSPDVVWREQEVRETQDVILFVPEETWRDKPLASLTMRPARTMSEVWQARLLDQVLPPEVLVDKRNRGEIMIPVRNAVRLRLEFTPVERRMEVVTRKRVPVPIEMEGGAGRGGQLLYILLDNSASMRGKSATLAMAAIAATLRANMGMRDTRYLFRSYSEETWPPIVEPPVQARTLAEKDALLDTILGTNFNGGATHVNDALGVAVTDIENLRREEKLEASILLVTDGRAEMWESTCLRLRAARVKVHTVMVTRERNPSLESISESFTALDIEPDMPVSDTADVSAPATPKRRSYHI